MNYYDAQVEKLNMAENAENFIKVQISSVGGKTNYITITEKQLTQIIAILKDCEYVRI